MQFKMSKNPSVFLLFAIVCSAVYSDGASCDSGWTAFKDENCIKIFNNLLTYSGAKNLCAAQGGDATLAQVKDESIQDFLSEATAGLYNSVWLGGKYDNESEQFKWEDGDQLTYTNWQEGYPKNNTGTDTCIELRPPNSKFAVNSESKWANVPCLKQNIVLCQKSAPWSLEDAVSEIKRMRKQFEADNADLGSQFEAELNEAKSQFEGKLADVSSQVVPVGSIYIEYSNQPSPVSLWPKLSWQDISDTYAGMFFRASGGESEEWGVIQSGCAPRVTQMGYTRLFGNGEDYPEQVTMSDKGWSPLVFAGAFYNEGTRFVEGMRLYTEHCEVRPTNQAVRIWKRTA